MSAASDVQMCLLREDSTQGKLMMRGNDLSSGITTLTWAAEKLRWRVGPSTFAGDKEYEEMSVKFQQAIRNLIEQPAKPRKKSGPPAYRLEAARNDAVALLKNNPLIPEVFNKGMREKGHKPGTIRSARDSLGIRIMQADGCYRLPPT